MIRAQIPYKSHNNKYMWDYLTQLCTQLNNINLAETLDSPEASIDNVMYVLLDSETASLSMAVFLSNRKRGAEIENDIYSSYCDVWAEMKGVEFISNAFNSLTSSGISVFSFDIKKYNSVLSFAEDYKDRDKIKFYIDFLSNKLYYCVTENNYVDLSPIAVSNKTKKVIVESYKRAKTVLKGSEYMTVTGVDKNSFLMPFMAYKDFLNFATYTTDNQSAIIQSDVSDTNYFVNTLIIDDDLKFYSKSVLRKDKFDIKCNCKKLIVPTSLWQVLIILQHFKSWQSLHCYLTTDSQQEHIANLVFNSEEPESATAVHILKGVNDKRNLYDLDTFDYELVGKQHSNELFRLNKLYSNANRTCYFDFSNQTFTGNNYVFSDDKLEPKTVELETKVTNVTIPLRMTFTELKHYIGSDLSQKNFVMRIYTDGIRVMLVRSHGDTGKIECVVVFNHALSKKNQNLPY